MPAVLEYLPYRKGDATAIDDSVRHPYFAGHGYAGVRVDIRGSGDSEGVLPTSTSPQEQDDALEVLRWIAAQPWCTASIGMMGISWGGFNSLQVAARRPPELKAIITACSTDDRYADDVHYIGGCGARLLPAAVGIGDARLQRAPARSDGGRRRWREMWLERLEAQPVPGRDVARATSGATTTGSRARSARTTPRSTCAVYVVGGWSDGYTNAILRLLEGLLVPAPGR